MTTIDADLRLAITKKRLVKLSYSGSLRVVEPHDYGVQKGTSRLLGYQKQNLGPRKSSPGWRLFDVEKIKSLSFWTRRSRAAAAHRTRTITFGTSSTRVLAEAVFL